LMCHVFAYPRLKATPLKVPRARCKSCVFTLIHNHRRSHFYHESATSKQSLLCTSKSDVPNTLEIVYGLKYKCPLIGLGRNSEACLKAPFYTS
jgi:hypothetical protein